MGDTVKKSIPPASESAKQFGDDVKNLGGEMDNAGQKASIFGDMLKANLAADALKAGLSALADAVSAVGAAIGNYIAES